MTRLPHEQRLPAHRAERFFEQRTKSGIQVKYECRLRLMLSRLEVMRDLQIEPLLRIATEGTSSP